MEAKILKLYSFCVAVQVLKKEPDSLCRFIVVGGNECDFVALFHSPIAWVEI